MSKTQILVHIVFTTKNRLQTISLLHKRELYRYIHGVIENNHCHTIRINGMTEHVHILLDLNPKVALADLVKMIKQSSSVWMKTNHHFNLFEGWNTGYYASSISPCNKNACNDYIKNQQEHHGGKGILEELKDLALEYHLEWDERDWC